MLIKNYDDALKRIRNSEFLDNYPRLVIKPAHGVGQYQGLKWIRCTFSSECKVKEGYERVEGFHIMPYRIKSYHLKNAVISGFEGKKFKDQDDNYSDFDTTTGNIHICPNGIWQIVLIVNNGTDKNRKFGPGWDDIKCSDLNVSYKIKNDYYFPRIDSPDEDFAIGEDNDDGLFKLIDKVIKEITVQPCPSNP